jgi:hypothetical protein
MLMTAHVVFAAFDAARPATLSPEDEDNQALAEAALIREAERDSALRRRICESAQRVRALKHAHAALPPIAREGVGSPAHQALFQQLAGR